MPKIVKQKKGIREYEITEKKTADDMYIDQFKDWLVNTFGVDSMGRPIDYNLVNRYMEERRLPRYMGGNILQVRLYFGKKIVTVLPEKFKFYDSRIGKKKIPAKRKDIVDHYIDEANKYIEEKNYKLHSLKSTPTQESYLSALLRESV